MIRVVSANDTIFKKSHDYDFLDEDEWRDAFAKSIKLKYRGRVVGMQHHPDLDEALRRGWEHNPILPMHGVARGEGDNFEVINYHVPTGRDLHQGDWQHVIKGEGPMYVKTYPTFYDAVRDSSRRGYKEQSTEGNPSQDFLYRGWLKGIENAHRGYHV